MGSTPDAALQTILFRPLTPGIHEERCVFRNGGWRPRVLPLVHRLTALSSPPSCSYRTPLTDPRTHLLSVTASRLPGPHFVQTTGIGPCQGTARSLWGQTLTQKSHPLLDSHTSDSDPGGKAKASWRGHFWGTRFNWGQGSEGSCSRQSYER